MRRIHARPIPPAHLFARFAYACKSALEYPSLGSNSGHRSRAKCAFERPFPRGSLHGFTHFDSTLSASGVGQPNIDAVAELDSFQGGIANVTLKSGSNAPHGSAFEFLQNDKLNANNWARSRLHLLERYERRHRPLRLGRPLGQPVGLLAEPPQQARRVGSDVLRPDPYSGRELRGNWNRGIDAVLGGWQLSGVYNAKTGFPWTITGVDRSGTVSRGARANRVGDGNDGPKTVGPGAKWFDTSAYTDTLVGTFGNAGAGTVHGPGYSTLDLGVEKSFAITERQRLQFRTDFINLTNSLIFQAGNRPVTSPTFGEITSAQGERVVQFGLRYEF